ncbi:MAG TPA: hypothetical protein H9841_05930 [Candidatus Flavonifractor merdigallinarum]|uniref:Uncharacterized protein n=1 Tax=Candidatus Flavonifractor merdigallinarum TaxID=2838589 RepID=A0A9D2BXQ1_9FIRM|nr:hypothetical protein [Candidatus Flavonifractor merdigallinarum]
MKRNLSIIGALILLVLIVGLILVGGVGSSKSAKPVLYLYPEEETQVRVKLDYDGKLTSTYPAYGDG